MDKPGVAKPREVSKKKEIFFIVINFFMVITRATDKKNQKIVYSNQYF